MRARRDLCDVVVVVVAAAVVVVCEVYVSADSFQIHPVPSIYACIAIAPHNIPIELRWGDANGGWLEGQIAQPSRFRPPGSDRAARLSVHLAICPFWLAGGWQAVINQAGSVHRTWRRTVMSCMG